MAAHLPGLLLAVGLLAAKAADRVVHMIKLTSPAQVDDQLREWLTEAYDFNTD